MKCSICDGTGLENENKLCPTCNGYGLIEDTEDHKTAVQVGMESETPKVKAKVGSIKKSLKK